MRDLVEDGFFSRISYEEVGARCTPSQDEKVSDCRSKMNIDLLMRNRRKATQQRANFDLGDSAR